MSAVHTSPFAGSWYPGSASTLRELMAQVFAESCRRTGPWLPPDALAYVVPHAAPMYSGNVAAAVYRALGRQQPERIVVLAFPHHGGLSGLAVPDADAIATPLGEVRLDPQDFPRLSEGELCDHSFEVQLPYLQTAAPESRITALYVGRMTPGERSDCAARLAACWHPGTVFLASSDFTHYGRSFHFVPFPPDAACLRALDFDCMQAAGSLDAGLFLDTLAGTGATVCGAAPVALLLETLRRLGADDVYQATLDYQTSAEISGDRENSVSYAALAYHRREAFALPASDGEALLDAAEGALLGLRENGRRNPAPACGSSGLQARYGAFVTLQREEELLGCLGNLTSSEPLAEEVPRLTLSAALEDPRFRPAAESSGPIDIEISVLTPLRRIREEEGFTIGKHGAVLQLKHRSGLLLPQVAEDHAWTSAGQFLAALARKTLLPRDAWRWPDARLSVFEAQRFSRPGLRGRS